MPGLHTTFSNRVNAPFQAYVYTGRMENLDTPLNRLLAEANRRGWKDADLCRRLGIKQQVLNNWKRRGLSVPAAITIGPKLGLSLDYLLLGRRPPDVSGEGVALSLYSTPPEQQKKVLDLFDQLTVDQQETVLEELQASVTANLAVIKHFQGQKRLRPASNKRVEENYGLPPSKRTVTTKR